jgi:hypothetical protein
MSDFLTFGLVIWARKINCFDYWSLLILPPSWRPFDSAARGGRFAPTPPHTPATPMHICENNLYHL